MAPAAPAASACSIDGLIPRRKLKGKRRPLCSKAAKSVAKSSPSKKVEKEDHASQDASWKFSADGRKQCSFRCGFAVGDPDMVNPVVPIRWAYKDGSGSTCWYCERVWASERAVQIFTPLPSYVALNPKP